VQAALTTDNRARRSFLRTALPKTLARLASRMDLQERLGNTVAELSQYPWLKSAGDPRSDLVVARDLSDAVDGSWDGWGPKSDDLWLQESHKLETAARETISDAIITGVFDRVGTELSDQLWRGIESYFERMERNKPGYDLTGAFRACATDAFRRMQSDIAWAVVEILMDYSGFFCMLLCSYRGGRWPCGWAGGAYPDGSVVVL
jgi:hypothetical protein